MLALVLALQLAAADSLYATPALRTLVADASRRNRNVPRSLQSYRADVESEIAIVARRAEGTEGAVSIEQVRNDVRWDRNGDYEQRVVGYRSQAVGLTFSALGFFRSAWTVPILYGNRISLLFGRDTSRARIGRPSARRVVAVHPLAEDRDRVYRYTGGDTAVTMRVSGRAIPIVRVLVEPRPDAPPRTVAFRGELDLDATRHTLVRMRGHFVTIAVPRTILQRVVSLGGLEAIAFVELENGEFNGQYWLPTFQRFEAQASWTSASDARSIFRIASRFRSHRVNDSTGLAGGAAMAEDDTLVPKLYRLSFAPRDSVTAFDAWRTEIGTLTEGLNADDFDDVAPDGWRAVGAPRFAWRVQRTMDAVHFNRVEGLYTGWGAELRLRDALPGFVARANAGWAWREETVRGRAGVEWKRGVWGYALRGGRTLDITNDFRSPFDSGSTLGALLFSVDNYDYVDRRLVALGVSRVLGRDRSAILRVEMGPARDAMARRAIERGLLRPDSSFRENRGVRAGRYWRSWAALEWRPDVNAEFMRPGVGGRLLVENALGDLAYTRIEGRVTGRRNVGAWSLAARFDAGTLLGSDPPPQQLFELGSNQDLPGYDYKEFAGTEAVVARSLAMYRLPIFRAPLRLFGVVLPSPSPALALGGQSAWSGVRGDGGRRAVEELGVVPTSEPNADVCLVPPPSFSSFRPICRPISRPTDGFRTSVTAGVRFFGGALGLGVARALDRKAAWRAVVDFSQIL